MYTIKENKGVNECLWNQIKSQKEYSNEQERGKKEFSFLQETIKSEQMTGRKLASRITIVAACGIIFGLMSCVGFFALKPWTELTFHQNTNKVTIPKDKEEEEPEKNRAGSDKHSRDDCGKP